MHILILPNYNTFSIVPDANIFFIQLIVHCLCNFVDTCILILTIIIYN